MPTTRLGAGDWVRAALDIMVDEGIAGVRIPRLCERLGVTKGSFYWHFADLDAFLGEIAAAWAAEGPRKVTREAPSDPDQRLLHAMRSFSDPRNRRLARAMRDWGQHDERARAAIRRADEATFLGVKSALTDLGFSDEDAEVRAKVLYYCGVGFAHVGPLGTSASAERQLTETWAIISRPSATGSVTPS